jgi:hypothetical protein
VAALREGALFAKECGVKRIKPKNELVNKWFFH